MPIPSNQKLCSAYERSFFPPTMMFIIPIQSYNFCNTSLFFKRFHIQAQATLMLDSTIMLSMVSPWQFPVGFHLLVGGVVQLPFNLCMTFFSMPLVLSQKFTCCILLSLRKALTQVKNPSPVSSKAPNSQVYFFSNQ